MYNDCWGEVGWTIIDYYLRRKISFYGVKRAFAPVKLILRASATAAGVVDAGDGAGVGAVGASVVNVGVDVGVAAGASAGAMDAAGVTLAGCNDTAEDIDFDLTYGYITFDGSFAETKTVNVRLPARQRKTLLTFSKDGLDPAKGVWFAKPANTGIAPAILRTLDTKNLSLPPVKAYMTSAGKGGDLIVNVRAETYCHGLYLDAPSGTHMSDNYFDLLPGESRDIIIKGGAGKTFELKSINVG